MMLRRTRIVLVSAAVLLLVLGVLIGAFLTGLQTSFGREQVRRLLVSLLRSQVHGRLYVGTISDGFFDGVTVDSLEIRDPDDSLFISTGRVTLHYDLHDLVDRRILLRAVRAEHPVVYLRQHENGEWNFRQVFRSSGKGPARRGPGFGDYVVIDSALVRNATLLLTMPWHPSAWLRGAARDSAIRFELARKDHEIRHAQSGGHPVFTRTWRWTHADAVLSHARIAHPDSAGMLFRIADLRATEMDPPFTFRNVRGDVRKLGDSIWIDVPHFDLPGSRGRATGKVVWGSNLPVRYAVHVVGDTVSLADVAWVYPTLPRTGGGRSILDIRSDRRDPHFIDYALSDIDVRSTRSHLTGAMTFRLGADTLIVKDVRLAASPVNFDLLRALNGAPFPYNWQGDITGTVRASGGSLGRFKVEDASFTFADANVPGAVTRGSARGELDIFRPAFTAFHGFDVSVETLDLRTLQALNPAFPRLNGTVAGTATLDSSWLDVRFRNASLFHRDGPGPESHVTGSGRVTWGEKYLTYDLDLAADSLSFTTLARSYPYVPLRGSFAGPIRTRGQSPDLALTTALAGPTGSLSFDGRVDADPLVYGAHGTGTVSGADLRALLGLPEMPRTVLAGTYAIDVTGDTLPHLVGSLSVALAPSTIGETRLGASVAKVRFDSGFVHVDTLALRAEGARVDARGSVSMMGARSGTLDYTATVDSISAIGRLLGTTFRTPVEGHGTMTGTLSGTTTALAVTGAIDMRDVAAGPARLGRLVGTVSLADLLHTPTGMVQLGARSVLLGAVTVDTLVASFRVAGLKSASFRTDFMGAGRVRGMAAGRLAIDTARTDVYLDTARVTVDTANAYRLSAPVHLATDTRGVSVDSLLFERERGGAVAIRGVRLTEDSVRGSLRTSGVNLAFFELFGDAVTDLTGNVAAAVDVSGSPKHPRITGSVTLDGGAARVPAAGVRLENIHADVGLDGDTVRVRTLAAETNRGGRRGTVVVDGRVAIGQYDNPFLDLRARASSFRAVDVRGLAALDVSTPAPVTITGPYRAAVVHGGIRVDRGTIYIPELINKRVVSLNDPELYDVIDTTVAANRALLPRAPSEFTRNLRLENVSVGIGDDVWLRSAEANVKLGGALQVTLGTEMRTGTPQLALEGELVAQRGTYRLNVVPLVQPVFDVERGTLRFYGTPEVNPSLDITAIHTVRQPRSSVNRQDVRIRASIGGTLAAPTLALSSADNLPLTQSDLLSYLITGEPAFALDYRAQQYVDQLAAAAIRSAGNVISSAIPRSVFDVVELQTPGAGDAATGQDITNPTLANLLNTRAVVGKQLNSRLFLNFSTGFCAANFRNNLGLRLEYQFNRTYTGLLGLEPASSDLACARGATSVTPQTPQQFGLDIFRAWRF